jgi:hypothetical protein
MKACRQLTDSIIQQERLYTANEAAQFSTKKEIIRRKQSKQKLSLEDVRTKLSAEETRANDIAQLKGASSWLNAIPTIHDNHSLNKREFHDALALRYCWRPKYLPSVCECGKPFSVDHALSCVKGGFVHQRHDALRDALAKVINDVCNDVTTEPPLLKLTGEQQFQKSANTQDDARLDIAARSFWVRGQRAFFDVRVFHPFARSHVTRKLQVAFKGNENEKKRQYNKRVIDIEHGSFSHFFHHVRMWSGG